MREVFKLWVPLAATFVLMVVELPVVTALIARLPEPVPNLAAFGVLFSILLFFEAPILMLISAANALATDRHSYDRLRNFAFVLAGSCSVLLGLTGATPIGRLLCEGLMELPRETSTLALYGAVLITPCPFAVGSRRFYQGVLVRMGKSKSVATASITRFAAMGIAGGTLYALAPGPGIVVGAASLSVGMTVEAVVVRYFARHSIEAVRAIERPPSERLSYRAIVTFYFPLALTTFVNILSTPLTSFFTARATAAEISLAVLPVVNGLSLMFRTGGFAFQEVVIALAGKDAGTRRAVTAFAWRLAAALSGAFIMLAVTPLGRLWFANISGLNDQLVEAAIPPTLILCAAPALVVLSAYLRGTLLLEKKTRAITLSSFIESAALVVILVVLTPRTDVTGVVAAAVATIVSSGVGSLVLLAARWFGPAESPQLSPT